MKFLKITKTTIIGIIMSTCLFVTIYGQENIKKQCVAIPVSSEPLLDGILNDNAWKEGDWQGDFVQFEPYNGHEPGQKTLFKVLYNQNHLFVGICAYDQQPDSISYRLTRRDIMDGDYLAFTIDTYHDLTTAYGFFINAAGVKYDEFFYENGSESDLSWDPVWYGKTSSDEKGWYAELKIPFSQLRFENDSSMLWGVSVMRNIFRKSEVDLWVDVPKDAPGWIHLMGELYGISVTPRKQLEITPYIKSSIKSKDSKKLSNTIGIDGKIGLTNNATLDYTFNPDFGQVEADPSEVNLTVFETFYEDKRPFFIEGSNITSFSIDLANNLDNLFYSRRIGRSPRNNPTHEPDESVIIPGITNIIGAGKITTKNNKGLSVGIIEGVTAHEFAKISDGENTRYETAEPLTNYFVSRINKEYNKGKTVIGGIFTSTNRAIGEDSTIFWMPDASYTGGLNFSQTFDERNYMLDAKIYFSHVLGKDKSITRLQLSPTRYYQRPDQNHLSLDTTKTTLSGTGGNLSFMKSGKGHFNYIVNIRWNSPGLELNDVGYLRSADLITQVFWINYSIWEPKGIYKDQEFSLTQWASWNFGGRSTIVGLRLRTRQLLKNNWTVTTALEHNFNITDAQLLRGGSYYRLPARSRGTLTINTDNRRKFSSNISISTIRAINKSRTGLIITPEFSYKPDQRLSISINPAYSYISDKQQFVRSISNNNSNSYILANIKQLTVSASLRLNYTIIPDLTIEYWGQPFISNGNYSEFKKVINPSAENYSERFHQFSPQQITETDRIYRVDEDIDGLEDYSFANPDFNAREFLSNLVLRWEFKPGSTVFLVWNQTISNYINDDRSGIAANLENLFNTSPNNVFLIKLSYRIGR